MGTMGFSAVFRRSFSSMPSVGAVPSISVRKEIQSKAASSSADISTFALLGILGPGYALA